MKKSAQTGNTFLIILICAAIIIGTVTFFTNNLRKNTDSDIPSLTPTTTKFQSSSALKFSVDVPANLVAVDNNGYVQVANEEGKILIIRNGSFFNNLKEYLSDLEAKNGFILSNKDTVSMSQTETITGNIGDEKNYFIMPEGSYAVYILSTKSPQLYSALDQIAKSFRYTP